MSTPFSEGRVRLKISFLSICPRLILLELLKRISVLHHLVSRRKISLTELDGTHFYFFYWWQDISQDTVNIKGTFCVKPRFSRDLISWAPDRPFLWQHQRLSCERQYVVIWCFAFYCNNRALFEIQEFVVDEVLDKKQTLLSQEFCLIPFDSLGKSWDL